MAWYWLGIGVLIGTVLILPAGDLVTGLLAWTLVGVLAAVAIFYGVLRYGPGRSWPWAVLATGVLASTGADALYSLVDAGAPAGALALANVLYVSLFVAAAVAQLRFARSSISGAGPAGLLDAVTVTLVLLLLVYLTIVSPARPGLTALTSPALVAYPIGDALLVAIVIRLLTAHRRTPAVLFLAGANLAGLIADALFGLSSIGGSPHEGAVTNLGWLLSYAGWGAAALHPSMARLTESAVRPDREITARTATVLLLSALTPPLALLVEAARGTVRDAPVLAIASAGFFGLSLSRMAAAANTHRRSLAHRDHHDTLTGLANRAWFADRVEQARGRGDHAAVLLLDLDDFTAINDTLGHSVGDDVLITVAHRITRVLGRHDLGARVGADEFAVLVLSDVAAADRLGGRLGAAVGEPISFGGRELRISACVGLATAGPGPRAPADAAATEGETAAEAATEAETAAEADVVAEDLIRQAGLALRAAQANGPGQLCRYRSEVHAAILARMRLRGALGRAVTDGAFTLHFQPILTLDPEHTVGFEALIRWEHPTLGQIPPSDFIELAEETGHIEAIGAWVLRGAVTAAAHWYRTHPNSPYISVNVSARQFRTPGLADRVDRELTEAGLPPSRLMIELTESVLLREEDQVWAELATLRDTGVRLAIDDFGTGFSSLSYLVQTPIDVIKIDKSFVRNLGTSPRHYAIINGIIRLAQQLGLQVVAEGIETAADRDLLVRMGCRYGQGYLFSAPMTSTRTEAWLDGKTVEDEGSGPLA